jgi:transposase
VTGRLLTTREVAERERVSTETVLRWYRRGAFEGVAFRQPSGKLRFREDRLDAREEEWATTERGSVSRPAGRRPVSNLTTVSRPTNEEK